MEVVKQFENKLLNRTEVEGVMKLGVAPIPSRVEVKKNLAKKLKVDEKLIVVNKISSSYGSSEIKVDANVYKDEATLKKITNEHLIKRNKVGESQQEEAKEE